MRSGWLSMQELDEFKAIRCEFNLKGSIDRELQSWIVRHLHEDKKLQTEGGQRDQTEVGKLERVLCVDL